MDLRTYTLGELDHYLTPLFSSLESKLPQDHPPQTSLPLSPLRLKSYLNNPRANQNDTVLFEMFHENQLVGYRSLLPDLFFDKEDAPQQFAWLSGNWVHPEMRRKGISTKLLIEAEKKWEGRLMYTNYAPDSKALYDNTRRFFALINREGRRYYLRSNSEELLGNRVNAKGLLRKGDQAINQIREQKLLTFTFPDFPSILVESVEKPSSEMEKLISRLQKSSLFRRETDIFNWALENPWVTDRKLPSLPYHFSYQSEKFENFLYEYRHTETGARGLLWLIQHNRAISVPYLFAEDEQLFAAMAKTLLQDMIKSGCTHTTIRHADLNKQLMAYKKIFLSSKSMSQFIFAHRMLAASVPSHTFIHDGDGDVMFTG